MSPDLAQFLDQHGFPRDRLSAPQADGRFTPLMRACYHGNPALLQRLIDAGIEIDRQNGNGATCLMYVSSNGKAELVRLLLANGADPALRNLDDFSALDLASTVDCLRLLKMAA